MRIALTSDPDLPVPPLLYGGIERVIDILARGLVERGHDVTLFAHKDSNSAGTLVPWPGEQAQSKVDTLKNAATLTQKVVAGKFDIVHSFSRIAYLTPLLPLSIPKVMTYQRAVTRKTVTLGHKLSRGTLSFTAISDWMMADVKNVGHWDMVPNGVPLATYTPEYDVADDSPLIFLGRLEEIKGPHLAIDIAKRTNNKLIIAGNIPPEKQAWFDSEVAPHIDGEQIKFVGPVNDQQKNELLGSAKAFLMPILWDEPFGIVMAEALACGTPVLGTRRGAVPEVVDDGVTGFVRDTADDLVDALGAVDQLSRRACRQAVEAKYSNHAIVEGYIDVYRSRLA